MKPAILKRGLVPFALMLGTCCSFLACGQQVAEDEAVEERRPADSLAPAYRVVVYEAN